MLSISIRYGGKLSYAMRALGPMLGSNSCQAETALSQVFGHDGASRHTLLSKMLRHNSARAQNHSDTSIDLRQRSCAAVCDMFLGKNHGSHFTTIKSIGKTHHPVPLRFAVNGSASARYASLATAPAAPRHHGGSAVVPWWQSPPTPATTGRHGGGARKSPTSRGSQAARQRHAACDGRAARQRHAARDERAARQNPAAPGQQRHPHLYLYLRLLMLRPLRRHSHQRRHPVPEAPQRRITQSPTAPKRQTDIG